jgi:hypothetical protein
MTEQEWLVCTDPEMMLVYLRGKISERKLRLFACSCFANIRLLLTSSLAVEAVGVAERFADGLASAEELHETRARLMDCINVLLGQWRASREAGEDEQPDVVTTYEALALAYIVATPDVQEVESYASKKASEVYAQLVNPNAVTRDEEYLNSKLMEKRNQVNLLRDLFGLLPFREVHVNPTWLSWNGGTIPRLAQAIYGERAFDLLPVLADALEEAGCTNRDILSHCRSGGEHVRGCWVVDALLGKQ